MEKMLNNFIKEHTNLDFGFCPFSEVENYLIDCAAKKRLPLNSKTVISFIFPYKCKKDAPLNISRYAAVTDYHIVCGEILKDLTQKLKNNFKDHNFEYFVDNSPIPEVRAAALCGLGTVGKNNLLITKKWGSFVFLGEIITDMDIKFHPTILKECENCNKCAEKCPTGHIKNVNLPCLSDITQKKKITEEDKKYIEQGNCLWGCDICQECCPKGKESKITNIKEFLDSYRDSYTLNEDNKNRAYNWRGEEIIKRNYEILSKSKQS